MSGFLLAWSPEGQQIDQGVLGNLENSLQSRYPDGSDKAHNGSAAAVFAALRTVDDVRDFAQPHQSSEGWLFTADVRLDDRDGLRAKLSDANLPADAADAEYALAAYRRWGRDCVDHLRGDYAFALLDGQDLFVAHDQFAVIPVYYTKIGGIWIVSNDLKAMLAWPGCDDRLNDQFIADYLLFGMNMDTGTTAYRNIQRLRPGHAMVIGTEGVRTWQYYRLPPRQIDRRRSEQDIVAEFREHLKAAVRDRSRWPKISTHLSGGMDSSTVAALAAEHLGPENVSAHNFRYCEFFVDEDASLAALIANHLGIGLRYYDMENLWRSAPPPQPLVEYPEPLNVAHWRAETYSHTDAAGFSPVIFTGFGGDPLLDFGPPLPGQQAWRWFRQTLRDVRHGRSRKLKLPSHLTNSPFAKDYPLTDRWQVISKAKYTDQRSGMFDVPLWSNMFAWSTPSFQPRPVSLRYPFFDLRLVEFAQSVPSIPWLRRKRLLRDAMDGILPDVIVERPKTNLPLNIYQKLQTEIGIRPWQRQLVESEFGRYYFDQHTILADDDDQSFYHAERMTGLLHWLNTKPGTKND